MDTINEQWLQQDGAPAHAATVTLKWLQERFGGGSSSPDLMPPDFHLWSHVKERAYKSEAETSLS